MKSTPFEKSPIKSPLVEFYLDPKSSQQSIEIFSFLIFSAVVTILSILETYIDNICYWSQPQFFIHFLQLYKSWCWSFCWSWWVSLSIFVVVSFIIIMKHVGYAYNSYNRFDMLLHGTYSTRNVKSPKWEIALV